MKNWSSERPKGAASLTRQAALHLMDCPVAMKSNLHDVLFAPASTKLWVANASVDLKPAAEQPYHEFQLTELLARKPDADGEGDSAGEAAEGQRSEESCIPRRPWPALMPLRR